MEYTAIPLMEVVVPVSGEIRFRKDRHRRFKLVTGVAVAAVLGVAALLLLGGDPKGAPPPEALAMEKALMSAAHGAPSRPGVRAATTQQLQAVTTNNYRLVGPEAETFGCGRMEVLHNGQWGSICDDGFNQHNAIVACLSLNMGVGVPDPRSGLAHQSCG